MRVQLLRLRIDGVLVPKFEIKYQITYTGDLRIFDELEDGYNRVVKIAEFKSELKYAHRLLDAEIVWMNDDRMTIKGFERQKTDRGIVDYAQSWLVTVLAPEPKEQEQQTQRYNQRR